MTDDRRRPASGTMTVMPMAVGAVLRSASTVIVAANAQLLRRLKLRPDDVAKPPDGEGSAEPVPA